MADFIGVELTAIAAGTVQYPITVYGKLRMSYFSYTATGASTTPNTYNLFTLPYGRVRVLPCLSRITTDAWGASRVLDLGNRAYYGEQRTSVAAVQAEYIASLDISGAVNAAAWSTVLKKDFFSEEGITGFATVSGGDQAASDTIQGIAVYATE